MIVTWVFRKLTCFYEDVRKIDRECEVLTVCHVMSSIWGGGVGVCWAGTVFVWVCDFLLVTVNVWWGVCVCWLEVFGVYYLCQVSVTMAD